MALFKSSNPTLSEDTFKDCSRSYFDAEIQQMTLNGTVIKTFFLLGLVVLGGLIGWVNKELIAPYAMGLWLGTAILGIGIALWLVWKKQHACFLAPLYAITQGVFVGFLSVILEARFPGIAIQAFLLTTGVLLSLLLCYMSGLIKASENFKLIIAAATGGIAIFYLVSIVCSMGFGIQFPVIFENSWLAIGFSVFVVCIAALNLVVDFDFIENGVEKKAPKYMEWYGAFALMVTLIWLYIEILRLLSKLRSR